MAPAQLLGSSGHPGVSTSSQIFHVHAGTIPLEVLSLAWGHGWGGEELVLEPKSSDAGSVF